jgi:hypothetical protein
VLRSADRDGRRLAFMSLQSVTSGCLNSSAASLYKNSSGILQQAEKRNSANSNLDGVLVV